MVTPGSTPENPRNLPVPASNRGRDLTPASPSSPAALNSEVTPHIGSYQIEEIAALEGDLQLASPELDAAANQAALRVLQLGPINGYEQSTASMRDRVNRIFKKSYLAGKYSEDGWTPEAYRDQVARSLYVIDTAAPVVAEAQGYKAVQSLTEVPADELPNTMITMTTDNGSFAHLFPGEEVGTYDLKYVRLKSDAMAMEGTDLRFDEKISDSVDSGLVLEMDNLPTVGKGVALNKRYVIQDESSGTTQTADVPAWEFSPTTGIFVKNAEDMDRGEQEAAAEKVGHTIKGATLKALNLDEQRRQAEPPHAAFPQRPPQPKPQG